MGRWWEELGVRVGWRMVFGGHVPKITRCFEDHSVSRELRVGQAPAPLWALLSQSVEWGQWEALETVYLPVHCGS